MIPSMNILQNSVQKFMETSKAELSNLKEKYKPFLPRLDILSDSSTTKICSLPLVELQERVRLSPPSLFSTLPEELILHLFCFLDTPSLISIGLTCCELLILTFDDYMWKRLFNLSKPGWRIYEKPEFIASSSSSNKNGKWKSLYLKQYKANVFLEKCETKYEEPLPTPISPLHVINNSTNNNILNASLIAGSQAIRLIQDRLPNLKAINLPFQKKNRFFVPMFGSAMDSSTAKDLVYSMMWNNNSMGFKLSGLCPGKQGFCSSLIFKLNDNGPELSIAAIHETRGVFRSQMIPDVWIRYLNEADGLVFVVNSNDDLKIARNVLETFIHQGGIRDDVPLIVLISQEGEQSIEKIQEFNVVDISEKLGLENILGERIWCVQRINSSNIDGVWQSLLWLTDKLLNDNKQTHSHHHESTLT